MSLLLLFSDEKKQISPNCTEIAVMSGRLKAKEKGSSTRLG
jgi:hypothetical protein